MTVEPKPPDSSTILKRMAVPGEDGVYVLGCFERPATMYMQQCRALNLLWALHAAGKVKPGATVAVFGGGVGGLTAAAAALLLGCKVTLLEKHGNLLPLQRGNHTRSLHPHIYYWPEDGSEELETKLPLLNWKADLAGKVAAHLLKQWADDFEALADVTVRTGCEVVEVKRNGGRPLLACHTPTGFDLVPCDCAILAVGFGIERNYEPLPFCSYWHDDNLHQPVLRKPWPRRYLVSGCGDGGLIDALRLQIDEFEHGDIHKLATRMLRADEDVAAIKKRLLQIDEEARRLAADPKNDPAVFLFEEYKKLNLSSQLKEHEPRLRADTVVHLQDRVTTPLTLKSAILNRFMTFVLVHYRGMKYLCGDVDWAGVTWEKGQGYRVTFKTGERASVEHYDEIIIRHGPTAAMESYFPGIKKKFEDPCRDPVDPTRQPMWPPDFGELLRGSLRDRRKQTEVVTSQRAGSEATLILGEDIEQGNRALARFQEDAIGQAPAVAALLKQIDINWTRTHAKLVMHRFKTFFAGCEQVAAPLLVGYVKEADWATGFCAAECFDYFTDHAIKVQVGNELVALLKTGPASLLDRPDPVRYALTSLGFLGAIDWRHSVLEVLNKTREDPDQKFRNYSLLAAALFVAKAPANRLWELDGFLTKLLYGFGAGDFSPSPRPIEDRELYWSVKRWLGRRNVPEGADHFINGVRGWAAGQDDEQGLVAECFAHVLGTLELPQAVPVLLQVLLQPDVLKGLRIECARSLGRMRRREAAEALLTAVPQLQQASSQDDLDPVTNLTRVSLVCVAHLAADPPRALETVLEKWHSDTREPIVLRAIGLCKAERHLDRLRKCLLDPRGDIRGHAGLALARLGQREDFQDKCRNATSELERVLFALADLQSGGRPDTAVIATSLQKELFGWSGQVVEDARAILTAAGGEYRKVIELWQPILDREPENLSYLYG